MIDEIGYPHMRSKRQCPMGGDQSAKMRISVKRGEAGFVGRRAAGGATKKQRPENPSL